MIKVYKRFFDELEPEELEYIGIMVDNYPQNKIVTISDPVSHDFFTYHLTRLWIIKDIQITYIGGSKISFYINDHFIPYYNYYVNN